MLQRRATRITRELTAAEQNRLAKYRDRSPRVATCRRVMKMAQRREEGTLSGELRRAIHGSELSLAEIATRAGITPVMLDDFLTGERTLRSDVIDRLTLVLGYEFSSRQWLDEMMGRKLGGMFPGNELDRHAKATPFALRLRDVPPNA